MHAGKINDVGLENNQKTFPGFERGGVEEPYSRNQV